MLKVYIRVALFFILIPNVMLRNSINYAFLSPKQKTGIERGARRKQQKVPSANLYFTYLHNTETSLRHKAPEQNMYRETEEPIPEVHLPKSRPFWVDWFSSSSIPGALTWTLLNTSKRSSISPLWPFASFRDNLLSLVVVLLPHSTWKILYIYAWKTCVLQKLQAGIIKEKNEWVKCGWGSHIFSKISS